MTLVIKGLTVHKGLVSTIVLSKAFVTLIPIPADVTLAMMVLTVLSRTVLGTAVDLESALGLTIR